MPTHKWKATKKGEHLNFNSCDHITTKAYHNQGLHSMENLVTFISALRNPLTFLTLQWPGKQVLFFGELSNETLISHTQDAVAQCGQ